MSVDETPSRVEMIDQLHEALGIQSGAQPRPPAAVWADALESVRRLAAGRCWRCSVWEAREQP